MSGIKFCGGKTTILVFTHTALGFKILGHISENVQKGLSQSVQAAMASFNPASV